MSAPQHSPLRTVDATTCTLCGSVGDPLYTGMRDRLFGAPGEWTLLRCAGCGLVWLHPRPAAADLSRLYERYHTHAEPHTDPERVSWVQRAVRRAVPAAVLGYGDAVPHARERALGRMLSWIGPLREAGVRSAMGLPAEARGRLLDVGCGSGLFLSVMQDLGWRIAGVELDPEAAEVARRELDSDEIHAGELADLALPPDTFDAITLSHVIEHLLDPVAVLGECRRLLRPGGWLAVATPNARSLGRQRFGRAWRGWEPPRHIHVFDPTTLRRVVEAAGFRVRSVSTPASAAPFLWAESAALAGRPEGGAAASNGIRAAAFWGWEYLLCRLGRPAGEEVLLLAERPA
ncbi:MAG: class I SAM-dependent methyltransferase [Proteobacteria bacterium]|nr:class I SAM-dependent methyltransferase [Pseudomonadota bacterium]